MPTDLKLRSRAIILLDNKLLVFWPSPEASASLPGGKHDLGETLKECMEREILEETGVPAQVGKLLFVYEFFKESQGTYSLEFFFYIKNSQDYKNIDFSKATHGNEVFKSEFIELTDDSVNLLPTFLKTELQEFLKVGVENWQTKNIVSRN